MSEKITDYSWDAESRGIPLREMFWETLKPFPERGGLTLRLAIACTLVVFIAETFRMPFQDLMPFLILFVTKEEKVTTAVAALLALSAATLAIAAAILIFKATGNRAEFRISGIALEIFIGMYLFRVLSVPTVGWILAFVVPAAESLVYLFPDPEETVHQFLWLWVAVALSVGIACLANVLIFPVSPTRLLQREFVAGWHAISVATAQLTTGSPLAGARLLHPLVKRGPTQRLKLLKLSLIESPDLRAKQVRLRRMILGLDTIIRLLFSDARGRLQTSAGNALPSDETAILSALEKNANWFRGEFEAGFLPSRNENRPVTKTAEDSAPLQLLEARNTVGDLAGEDTAPGNQAAKAAARDSFEL
jgi:hypothetical protein